MANKSRIQLAKADIFRVFEEHPLRVFKPAEIARILSSQRDSWRLAKNTTAGSFIDFLTESGKLTKHNFPFPYRGETRYVWGDVPRLQVIQTIKDASYFTHYTAMRMHGLTEQIPKIIYLNHEQPPHSPSGNLTQHAIDMAFARKPRTSNNIVQYQDIRICLVNGMHTNQLGVINESTTYDTSERVVVRLSGLERTLIDIAVRPAYSGGISEVQKAYRLAVNTVSVNRIRAQLEKLNYVYPYHQAIGFYLERAGCTDSALELIREMPMRFDFYLAHQMGEKEYVDKWRLFIPKGF